ncbi:hypothetical protein DN752_09075 [Echinicola strongylocentroti]|uniref:Beta-galactosidase trimerisation domain-containing protein n=1 Tax=Echinicola strongylocentroti TaxID=1795355 RepID=A0A2Z4IIK8_9BACT|nr:hypothetical protein [Echinicola strongylocentroti]AWW30263.1 hypothetical protein DN752_09075 [Echinicola strongylocentroti]
MQKTTLLYIIPVLLFIACAKPSQEEKIVAGTKEKTAFQTSNPWKPVTDVRADVAIVYSVKDHHGKAGMTFEERVQTWRDKGYTTHFMTGIAWGEYQDYFTGEWDGEWHLDEGQVTQKGDTLWHGHMVPYIVPSQNFINYLKEKVIKRVIDAGIDAIYLEEPEFWAKAGYSEAFKREWKVYYGFDWRPQHESAENTYLANKLKYHLYYRAVEECFSFAKEYGKSKGMEVRCYVPTHSLVNYSQWMIVSPEASLASLPSVDGYIAQVWTGTSREPNYYNGQAKERVFETAFLEYGSMESMTAPTGRKMYFLTDPIEDWPRDWADYKKNYQATFAAQLLYPMVANYEVMPWPDRIYEGLYRTSADSEEKALIPRFYSTQMQVMVNTLNDMPESDNKVSGSQGIGVLMSNSLMFQRFPTHQGYDDPQLSNFYGQTMPLLKRGVPVKTVHIENVSFPRTWEDLKILIMSYSNMKPMNQEGHDHIADWVKKGGVLVYCGRDKDAFQSVQEWWNTDGNTFNAPSEDLFQKLGLKAPFEAGEFSYGKGKVVVMRVDPKEFVLEENNDVEFVNTIKRLYGSAPVSGKLAFKNHFSLTRGAYEIISVVNENKDTSPYIAKGKFIDLFDPAIPVLDEKRVMPGEQAFLYNIESVKDPQLPQVLATAARVYDEEVTKNSYSLIAKSPLNTTNVMRILLPEKVDSIEITDANGGELQAESAWDEGSKTCFLSFENNPEGVHVRLNW